MNVAMLDTWLNHKILTAPTSDICRELWTIKMRSKALLAVSRNPEHLAGRILNILTRSSVKLAA